MSDDQKPETYGKALLQIAGMVGGDCVRVFDGPVATVSRAALAG